MATSAHHVSGALDNSEPIWQLYQIGTKMNWRTWRERCGLTQEDVADILGTSRAHYSRIENHKRTTSIEVARKLAKLFNLSVEERISVLGGLPHSPVLSTLPLQLNGQAVELLELRPDGEVWIALLRPQTPPGAPEATARHVPVAGLILLPAPASRAA